MEAVYGWVKNIIYYMIFLSVVNNLLADSKYEKYIRFFAGMVLILLVVSPLTGKLRLDEQISSMFRTISLHNDTSDLKSQLWEMDDRRLQNIMEKYKEAVNQDVAAMAEADGLICVDAGIQIDSDRSSSTYGQVTEIQMQVQSREEKKNCQKGGGSVGCPVTVDVSGADGIQVEPVKLGGVSSAEESPPVGGTSSAEETVAAYVLSPGQRQASTLPPGESKKIINHLTGKVAQYYGIEESHVKIRWKDD